MSGKYMKKNIKLPRSLTFLLLFMSSLYSRDILLESISLDSKANGIMVALDTDSTLGDKDVTAWQANSGWFYITLYKVKGDTSFLRKDTLPKGVLDFQVIQGEQSFQVGLRLRRSIEHYEFSSAKNNTLMASLHYSTEYFSTLDSIQDKSRSKQRNGIPIGVRKWLYLTGAGMTISGSIKDNDIRSSPQTQAGLAVILSTFIIDAIWKIL